MAHKFYILSYVRNYNIQDLWYIGNEERATPEEAKQDIIYAKAEAEYAMRRANLDFSKPIWKIAVIGYDDLPEDGEIIEIVEE